MNKSLVPKIRFKEFINENNFQKIKLKEICLIQKGKSISKDKYDINGKYCIFNGGINKSGNTNLFNKENCISISEGGNSCGYVNYIKDKFWSADHNYTLSKVNLNIFYLFYLLKNNEINIKKLRVGTGLPNIQKKDLENIIIYIIRNFEEQNLIGHFFTIIDRKIELIKEQLSLLEKQKQYYLNNMFANEKSCPKIRFKGFNDEWKSKKNRRNIKLSATYKIYN
ncbi:restriction endonuclease subunit S [Spiroplasma citri]|uniref:restriction endonuclease subunit S n=1 Tax=Spiroplasma citri TaxID=2133 RepID=UPI00148B1109|nr:restriction endonuclease subunit S [Spiroplasma citri]QJU61047.1 restriction endonuclease subunit S [Spiroplasma citri]